MRFLNVNFACISNSKIHRTVTRGFVTPLSQHKNPVFPLLNFPDSTSSCRFISAFRPFNSFKSRKTINVSNMSTTTTNCPSDSSSSSILPGQSLADQVSVVYVTAPDSTVADKLAGQLVSEGLAACVNIVPGLTSVYRWKGEICKDSELLLIIKTSNRLLESLVPFVKANHPYDECEVLALPAVAGSPSYLQWVLDSANGVKEAAGEGKP